MKFPTQPLAGAVVLVLMMARPGLLPGKTSETAKQELVKLLLGKDVKPLVNLPASKDGVDVYFLVPSDKRLDARGLDVAALSKSLKEKGIGSAAEQPETITDVKIDDRAVEIRLGSGGEEHGGNDAKKGNAGSRVNFRYAIELTDRDLEPGTFLKFMSRVLDASGIQMSVAAKEFDPEVQKAITAKTVTEGMNYQMVLMSFGDPEQKRFNDTTDASFSETWYYLKDGHRWVVTFVNGKVGKVQVY